jgi:hypothetical protein
VGASLRRRAGGYRLDHLLASAEVMIEDCRYEYRWRKEGPLRPFSAHRESQFSSRPASDWVHAWQNAS